jgi:hypothetical protein
MRINEINNNFLPDEELAQAVSHLDSAMRILYKDPAFRPEATQIFQIIEELELLMN